MTTFTYRDGWKMASCEVEADYVTFEPGHVVFRRQDGRVIVAVENRRVDQLREVLQP